jgi:hypothetical protein
MILDLIWIFLGKFRLSGNLNLVKHTHTKTVRVGISEVLVKY